MPPLKDHFVMLTNPPCYYAPHLWAKNAAIESLRHVETRDSYMITFDAETRRFRTKRIAPERLRAAAESLHQSLSGATPPFDREWFAFIAAL
jgi:hypothetical protein